MKVGEVIEVLKQFDKDMDLKKFCGSTNEIVEEISVDIEDGCHVID